MSIIPKNLKYTNEHEWLTYDSITKIATIGITDYAQESLGDITFIEFPPIGKYLKKGQIFGVLESIKSASDLYMPISGKILEINKDLEENPEELNNHPYTNGWIIKIEFDNEIEIDQLLSPEKYKIII